MGPMLAALAALALQVNAPWEPVPQEQASYRVKTGPGFPDIAFFPGQGLVAPQCGYNLSMRWDGAFVMEAPGQGAWYAAYPGLGWYAVFQSDGNLVLYDGDQPTWASNTGGYWDPEEGGYYYDLQLTDNGTLWIDVFPPWYGGDAGSLWGETASDGVERSGACHPPAAGLYTELSRDTDCAGSDYDAFYVDANPAACGMVCAQDNAASGGQCAAWAYVAPGIQADQAVCWLKNADPGLTGWQPGVTCGRVHFPPPALVPPVQAGG